VSELLQHMECIGFIKEGAPHEMESRWGREAEEYCERVYQLSRESVDPDLILEGSRTHLWRGMMEPGRPFDFEVKQLIRDRAEDKETIRSLQDRLTLMTDKASRATTLERALLQAKDRISELEHDVSTRNSELRRLHAERDPAALDRLVRIAVEKAGESSARELADLRSNIATQQSEIAELRASKRKLREALERTKEKR